MVAIDADQTTLTAGTRTGLPPAVRIALLQIALLAALLAAWELAIRFGLLAVYIYGQPSGVAAKAGDVDRQWRVAARRRR